MLSLGLTLKILLSAEFNNVLVNVTFIKLQLINEPNSFHIYWLINGNVQMLFFLLERVANTHENDITMYELIKTLINLNPV